MPRPPLQVPPPWPARCRRISQKRIEGSPCHKGAPLSLILTNICPFSFHIFGKWHREAMKRSHFHQRVRRGLPRTGCQVRSAPRKDICTTTQRPARPKRRQGQGVGIRVWMYNKTTSFATNSSVRERLPSLTHHHPSALSSPPNARCRIDIVGPSPSHLPYTVCPTINPPTRILLRSASLRLQSTTTRARPRPRPRTPLRASAVRTTTTRWCGQMWPSVAMRPATTRTDDATDPHLPDAALAGPPSPGQAVPANNFPVVGPPT
ncbi:hypothetical protein BDY21DRAFT_351279 [Lineolata rhizophorae]|uniref:Uncharacterized protein n=1 Tax=Lineolata rhizophorae TaxID=578093 RepID=A0A6A6NTQ8_9PEZI|nr:hypothetical protein BDY21DRAFT_351279 [Lineolata rhizophorae]